ncbi:radical SAM/SPASM domain-containing protein [Actinomadura terrae]|uniref:radical SAM/SPASM domain-containing protein n=1 Tax=Actinomadura terrae TaxID=604353 RepID=UPI001FA6F0E7|nr:radical SAM protein [Actinomadura terrae]
MSGKQTPLTLRAWQGGPVLAGPDEAPPPLPRFGAPDRAPFGAVGLADPAPPPAASEAAPEEDAAHRTGEGARAVYDLSTTEPVPFVSSLVHHRVDDDHLWIAVEDGKLLVADDLDHELLTLLVAGTTPADAARELHRTRGLAPDAATRAMAKLVGRVALAGMIRGIRGNHSIKKIRPHRFARFHLTNRCQLQCVHCYTSSSPFLPKDGELSTERWIRLVEDFAANGGEKLLLTGGEALVHEGCIPVMRRAHELGLEVTLFSNGMAVPKHLDDLARYADIVQISVDGPTAEIHDAIRGRHSFRRATRAIRLLLDAGVQTQVSTTIMMNNWAAIKAGLPAFIDEWRDSDVKFRISYGAMAHGRGTDLDHDLNEDEVRDWVDELLGGLRIGDDKAHGPNKVQKINSCGYAEQLVVASDGIVYPCHLLSGALGHIDQLPLSEITDYLKRTSDAFTVDNRKGCQSCDLRNLCGGTCRVEDEKHTGSRLITTCTPEEKLRRRRFLVRRYRPVPGAAPEVGSEVGPGSS